MTEFTPIARHFDPMPGRDEPGDHGSKPPMISDVAMPENAHRRAADPAVAAISLDETITANNSADTINGQGAATRRCPGCSRERTEFVSVSFWRDGEATLLCEQCVYSLPRVRGIYVTWETGLEPKSQKRLLRQCYQIKDGFDFIRDAIRGRSNSWYEWAGDAPDGAIAKALYGFGYIRSQLDDLEKELRLLQQEDERNAA